jgi:hypothetical protein
LLTAIGLTTGGSSTVHIYEQTVHRRENILPLPVFAPRPVQLVAGLCAENNVPAHSIIIIIILIIIIIIIIIFIIIIIIIIIIRLSSSSGWLFQ